MASLSLCSSIRALDLVRPRLLLLVLEVQEVWSLPTSANTRTGDEVVLQS